MADNVGLLRVVSPEELAKQQAEAISTKDVEKNEVFVGQLANHVRNSFIDARNHHESERIRDRLLHDLRTYRGQYSSDKLQEIAAFQGSQVFARLTSVKCRGASALLRDIYLSTDRPWRIDPSPEPEIPGNVAENVIGLVQTEVGTLQSGGQQIDEQMIEDRVKSLMDAAKKAEKKNARKEADKAADVLDDVLVEGGFYKALDDMLIDLPIFLFGCIKGPIIRKETTFKWLPDGKKEIIEKPKMYWERVSPFDLYFSPGASSVEHSTVHERIRLTRDELYDLKDMPGYSEDAIERVLADMSGSTQGMTEWMAYFETERAALENREDPTVDRELLFVDALAYNGYVRGQWLLDWGMPKSKIDDPNREYFTTCWLINNEIIKAQIEPNPRQRPNYYITSFEKIPGSIYGNGLPEILSDIQDVANATLRALVNNLAISSGPQVIIDEERIAPGYDGDTLYPWKRWHIIADPLTPTSKAVDFYQPDSNSAELLGVYKEFTNMADEISAIPRFLTGSQRTGGAASTASGLAMLMNNAGKVMQSVAANIDQDIIKPVLEMLYDMVMLTDPGKLRGDEEIVVRGVYNAIQREQDRVRQLEFLNLTSNPIDMQIIGPRGRAGVLRAVAENLGLEYEDIVAEDEQIQQMLQDAALQGPAEGAGLGANPNEGKSDSAGPRTDRVSNVSTV